MLVFDKYLQASWKDAHPWNVVKQREKFQKKKFENRFGARHHQPFCFAIETNPSFFLSCLYTFIAIYCCMYTPSKAKGPQYSFPILNADEIVQCLKELQIPFSEEQLKKPTSESIRATYEQILELLLGISREELQQPVFQALDVLSYPELHEYSVGQLNFHRNLQKLLEACGYHEFSMKDYLKPEYARTRKILSAIINFAKFREERLVTFLELQGRSEELTAKKNQLEEELSQLKEKVSKLRYAVVVILCTIFSPYFP